MAHEPAEDESPEIIYERFRALLMSESDSDSDSDSDNEEALCELFRWRSSDFQIKVLKLACEKNDAFSAERMLKYVSPKEVLKTAIKEERLTWWVNKLLELGEGEEVKRLLDKAKKKKPDSNFVRKLTKVLSEIAEDVYAQLVKLDKEADLEARELVSPLTDDQKITLLKMACEKMNGRLAKVLTRFASPYDVIKQAENDGALNVWLDRFSHLGLYTYGANLPELIMDAGEDGDHALAEKLKNIWEESQAEYRARYIKEFPEVFPPGQVVYDWKEHYEDECRKYYRGDETERQLLSAIKVYKLDDAIKAIDAYSEKATASLDFLNRVRGGGTDFSLFQWLRLNRSDVAEKLCGEIYVKIIEPFCGEDKAKLLSWAIKSYQPINDLFSDQTNGELELREACLYGNRAALQYLLEEVEPVERRPAVKALHLYDACQCHRFTKSAESEGVVSFLLNHTKDSVLADCHDPFIVAVIVKILPEQRMDSLLKYACKEGKIGFLQLSASCGVSVDSEDYLKAACENNPCFDGHYKVVAALLAKGVKITEALLNSAAIKDDMMRDYLKAQAGLMSQGELNAALLEACKKGHEVCVRLLLEKKADPNFVDKNVDSALTLACVEGRNPAVIQLLLRNKATQPTRVNGSTDLQSALKKENSAEEKIGPVLQDICEHGTSKEIQVFLAVLSPQQKFGALTYIAEKKGNTTDKTVDALFGVLSAVEPERALMFASRGGYVGALKKLLADTRDLNEVGEDGMTALIRACRYGHHEAVALLLGDERIDPNIVAGYEHRTALMFACNNKDMKMVQLLLDCKRMTVEGINFKNYLHETALSELVFKLSIAATEKKDDIAPLKEIVNALVEHGADPAIEDIRGEGVNTVMAYLIANADRFEDKRDVKDLVKLFLDHGADPSHILSYFSQQSDGDEIINLFMNIVLNGIQDETMRNKIMDNYRDCTEKSGMKIVDPAECYRAMKALVNDLNAAVPYEEFLRNRVQDSTPAFVAKIFDVGKELYKDAILSSAPMQLQADTAKKAEPHPSESRRLSK